MAAATPAGPANFHEVTSPEHFQNLLSNDLARVSLINFWAPWAEPCKQMNEVVLELAKKYPQVLVLQVEAEDQADIAESFDIEAVPAFVILRGHTLLSRISGADAPKLTQELAKHLLPPSSIKPQSTTSRSPAAPSPLSSSSSFLSSERETPEALNARLLTLMTQSPVVLFMKGSPSAPRCGFSRRIVGLLRDEAVTFSSFDVLEDEGVRQGLKALNDWPTFPQLIVKGEFVGGLDVVKEMVENGELKALLA